MKSKNKNSVLKLLAAISCFFLCVSTIIIFGDFHRATAEKPSLTLDEAINEIYSFEDQLILPGAKITVAGQQYNVADSYLVYPDGNAYKRKEYSLNQLGKYKACFVAESENGQISAEKEFRVYGDAYSVTLAGACEYREQLQMVDPDVAQLGGLGLTLNEGSVFTYNSAFDLTESDLTVPVVKIYPYTLTQRLKTVYFAGRKRRYNGAGSRRHRRSNVILCGNQSDYVSQPENQAKNGTRYGGGAASRFGKPLQERAVCFAGQSAQGISRTDPTTGTLSRKS